MKKNGSSLGSSPLSATVGTLMLKMMTIRVTTMMATSADGTTSVTLGHRR